MRMAHWFCVWCVGHYIVVFPLRISKMMVGTPHILCYIMVLWSLITPLRFDLHICTVCNGSTLYHHHHKHITSPMRPITYIPSDNLSTSVIKRKQISPSSVAQYIYIYSIYIACIGDKCIFESRTIFLWNTISQCFLSSHAIFV